MDAEAAIKARRTHKQYGSTPVDPETVRELVDLARSAPNHKLTQPWRFRVLGPEIRTRIEELAGEKEAVKLRRAPTLVLATAVLSGWLAQMMAAQKAWQQADMTADCWELDSAVV